ncbi:uncharacterized protein LOC126900387 [Daktulosphaira vitifoliae]|uniref:uncharacterized protein LOC126900387 n=1 Tax=Daktulosphaira vitifoliae TaxID=58002 RepID=UPI0021AA921B|nr:uncharacterized protein LOC126900387 [Daktulosphaira vitifoliae]XP_050532022.1 uncharacterized protein LOC126900387 [Daktulosphaira vitifoliae]
MLLFLCCALTLSAGAIADDSSNNTLKHSVDDFVGSLMQMIGSVLMTDAKYAQNSPYNDIADNSISSKQRPFRPNRPDHQNGNQYYPPPDFPQNYRPYPPPEFSQNGRPYPPPDFPQNGRPFPPPNFPQNGGPYPPTNGPQIGGPFPPLGRPPFPAQQYGQPPYLYRPQTNSIMQALSSISQHDDLRCVPRLLCEVSSGTRTSNYYRPTYQQQQQSTIPFLTKDALITLLTVLNFVDDSPLLMFGRAALLGYNSRDDPRSCITAYPTCPRDPDQLINYLNNHNGGFFRFFNQQLPQYAPQYGGYKGRADKEIPRILSGSPSQYYDIPSAYDLPLQTTPQKPTVFPLDHHNYYGGNYYDGNYNHVAAASYNDLTNFKFPSNHRRGKNIAPNKMVFPPDRTGTGGLRADLDQYGNYKGVYYAGETVKFDDKDQTYLNKMKFPEDLSVGNRIPYSRKQKLVFPSSNTVRL